MNFSLNVLIKKVLVKESVNPRRLIPGGGGGGGASKWNEIRRTWLKPREEPLLKSTFLVSTNRSGQPVLTN